MATLGEYARNLETGARNRYLTKIADIGEDPYIVNDFSKVLKDLPPVDYADVGYFLLYSTSYLTGQQLKARKSLECYTNFLNGWVLDVRSKMYRGHCVILGKVSFFSFTFKNIMHAGFYSGNEVLGVSCLEIFCTFIPILFRRIKLLSMVKNYR